MSKWQPLKQQDEPCRYAAGYSLDLYCRWHNPDVPGHDYGMTYGVGAQTFAGDTFADCARQARRRGWIIHKDRTATCPQCAKRAKVRRDDTEGGQGDE